MPSAAVARGGETLVMALCAELHRDGAVLPLLVLSDAPGVLGWEPAGGLAVEDESGRAYEVRALDRQAGLGALQAAVWIAPAPPPEARELRLVVTGLTRASAARGGGGVERELSGGPWELRVPLVPERTAVPPPPPPAGRLPAPAPARVPARAHSAFRGVVPIGQARLADEAAVCLWALERYEDRGVLTVAALTEEPLQAAPITEGHGRVEVWDDRGGAYDVAPIHGASRPGWAESSLQVSPALDPAARALGVRLSDLPAEGSRPAGPDPLAGPFTFGVALGAAG